MFGQFYAVEGIDGSGKTSAVKYIGEKLTEKKIPHLIVRSYPTGEYSEFMRDLWIQKRVPPECILQIVLSLRAIVLLDEIIPALKEGKIVISDRWHETTRAYQGYGQGLNNVFMNASFDQHFKNNNRLYTALNGFKDIEYEVNNYSTIYLGITLETSRSRVGVRGDAKDAFEQESNAFFERVLMGYNSSYVCREQFKQSGGTTWKIDANESLESVRADLDRVIWAMAHRLD